MSLSIYGIAGTDTLRHRETARRVLDEVEKNSKGRGVTLDFSGISFASRSFCHELKRGLRGREVVLVNMLPEVDEMMRLVDSKPSINFRDTSKIKKLKLVSA